MSDSDSVTEWVEKLRAGDLTAAQPLWERYFTRLLELADGPLRGRHLAGFGKEDVALSAFDSFCRGLCEGRFPKLDDRNDLWRVLVVLTVRKARRLRRDESRLKRGAGRVIREADLAGRHSDDQILLLAEIADSEPSPEFVVQVAEEMERLLANLTEDDLRQIAIWKMERLTTAEIAGRLGCAPRTVERKLARIRSIWLHESA